MWLSSCLIGVVTNFSWYFTESRELKGTSWDHSTSLLKQVALCRLNPCVCSCFNVSLLVGQWNLDQTLKKTNQTKSKQRKKAHAKSGEIKKSSRLYSREGVSSWKAEHFHTHYSTQWSRATGSLLLANGMTVTLTKSCILYFLSYVKKWKIFERDLYIIVQLKHYMCRNYLFPTASYIIILVLKL